MGPLAALGPRVGGVGPTVAHYDITQFHNSEIREYADPRNRVSADQLISRNDSNLTKKKAGVTKCITPSRLILTKKVIF